MAETRIAPASSISSSRVEFTDPNAKRPLKDPIRRVHRQQDVRGAFRATMTRSAGGEGKAPVHTGKDGIVQHARNGEVEGSRQGGGRDRR
jgi:hypothetical protein